MPHFPQTATKTRSPRVRVPNNESIRFNLGGHQVSAVLQKISLTGGLAEFTGSIGSATIAEAKVNTPFRPGQRIGGVSAGAGRFLHVSFPLYCAQ